MGLTVAELVATLGADASDFDQGLDGMLGKFAPIGGAATAAAAVAVAAIAAIGVAVIHYGGQFDNAFDSIRIGTGKTGAALAGLEDDFKAVVSSVPTDFASASTALKDVYQRLEITGRPLQKLTEQFLELSRITGSDVSENVRLGTRLFGDWSIASKDQAGALNLVFRATQQSGIGINDLMQTVVEFGAPLRNMGFSFGDSVAMLAKWEKEGVNTSTVLTGMKFALKTFAKAGEDPQKALAELIPKMHDMKDAQAAMTLGMQTFGLRAGPDMVAAIREGRFEYADFAKAIAGGHDTITKAAKDTADWQESLTLLKNQALVALEPALSAAFGGLSKAVDAAGKALTSGKAKSIFGGIADAFGVVRDKLVAAWRAIAPILMPVLREWVQTTQIYMRRIMPIVSAVFRAIVQVVRWAWPVVKEIILGALNVIAGVMRLVMALMRGDWKTAWKAVQQIVRGASRIVSAVVRSLLASLVAIGRAGWNLLKAATSAAWNGIVGAVKGGVSRSISFVASLPGRILGALGSLGSLLYNAGAELIGGLLRGIEDRLSALWSTVSSIAGKIRDLKGPLDYDRVLLRPAGQAIMAGLVQGIDEGTGSLERKLGEVTRSIRVSPSLGVDSALAATGAPGRFAQRASVIHEHYHVHMPGGSVLVGTLDEAARVLSPHVTRHQDRTAARKGRGR
jgi:phage-related minor tail protein